MSILKKTTLKNRGIVFFLFDIEILGPRSKFIIVIEVCYKNMI